MKNFTSSKTSIPMVVMLVISFFFQLFNLKNYLLDTEYLIWEVLPIVSSLLLTVYYVKFRNEAWAALSVPIALLLIGLGTIFSYWTDYSNFSRFGVTIGLFMFGATIAILCIVPAITTFKGMSSRFISTAMISGIILFCIRFLYIFLDIYFIHSIHIATMNTGFRESINYAYFISPILLFASIALVSTKCDVSKKISFRKTEKFLLNSTSEQALLRLKSELEQNKISQDEYNYLRAKVIKRL